MNLYRIKTLNKIAKEGIDSFGEKYVIDPKEKDPHGIIVRSAVLDTGEYPSLLAVARAGAGVNNITVDKATDQGICVFNTPGANANAVAELLFTMLGVWVRNIHRGIKFCRELADLPDQDVGGAVEAEKAAFRGVELAGKTLGVLGLGKIGIRVANGGIQRNMKVIGFDPSPALENIHFLSPEVILARSIAQVIRRVDILSVHLPLVKKTEGFVNSNMLQQMQQGATLINFARGPIVDESAVLKTLDEGHLDGYLTDFPTAATVLHPKVLCTPHLGASTEESEENCACMAARELQGYLEYGNITRSVNFPTTESIPSGNVHTRFIMINRDIPGMIGFASHIIGANGINIGSYLNESNGSVGYNIIDLETPISPEVVAEIEANPNVIRTRTILCSDD